MRAIVPVLLLCIAATAPGAAPPPTADELVWKAFAPAMQALQAGGSRDAFRATCRALLRAHPRTTYTTELASLVAAMDRDARATAPTLAASATPDDAARYWVYQLRDVAGHQFSDPGYPQLFAADSGAPPNAADQLVALGAAAIPRLVEALDDDTPTRTLAWQRSYYPVWFVLRREDVALKVLERITGARFYEEGATYIHLYMDKPERRQAVLDDVRAWWQHSAGKPQAEMIANQLALAPANPTLGPSEHVAMLEVLAQISGPEAVVPELRRMYAVDTTGLNSSVAEAVTELDPQTPARAVLERFWANRSRDGDYVTLYAYGDARVYAEIARRFAQTGKLDPGPWNLGDQARAAAEHGQGWAIPILAEMLSDTQMTGARWTGSDSQPFCDADVAVEELARLTGVDFGYHAGSAEPARLTAIAGARTWWARGADPATQQRIAAPHAVAVADLLRSDDELAATARRIESGDARTRRDAVATLGQARSFVVQRALVRALATTRDEADRRAILAALQPALWQLPAIADALAKTGDATTRTLAADRMTEVIRASLPQVRIEARYAALAVARTVAADPTAPPSVRQAAARAAASWAPFGEHASPQPGT